MKRKLIIHQSNDFTELNIKGNNFTSLDLGTHSPKMAMIIAGNNKIETFDATPYNNIRVLSLYGNGLKSITLNNADLFQLDPCEEPVSIWEQALTFNNTYRDKEEESVLRTMARYTPNFDKEVWKYLGLEILGIEEFNWKK